MRRALADYAVSHVIASYIAMASVALALLGLRLEDAARLFGVATVVAPLVYPFFVATGLRNQSSRLEFVISGFVYLLSFVLALQWARSRPPLMPRRVTGRCHGCGYDLRGNVSGVCPECGTPILIASIAPEKNAENQCAVCGQQLSRTEHHCPDCGTPTGN